MRSLPNLLSVVLPLVAAAPALAQCDPVEEQKLIASDGARGAQFGRSVSISGDAALVGAPWDDGDRGFDSGAAYIFERVGDTWLESAKLLAGDGAGDDLFGHSVSISGDMAAVGATGRASVYVFGKIGGRWWQTAKFFAADSVPSDSFGISVAVSGNAIVVGAPLDDDRGSNSGSAYIFEKIGSAWVQTAKLLAADGAVEDYFGTSVSISGDTVVVGAPVDDDRGSNSGSAYIFETAKLLAADGAIQDVFGDSVSISGDAALVGAPRDDDRGFESGSAYIFERIGGSWVEAAKLLAADGEEWDEFGISVSISGDTAVVGARGL